MPLNPKKPRSFLLQLFFLLFPRSFGVISFLHYPSVHSTLMQNTGLALNPPESAGGLRGSWQTWTRLIVSLCVFCGGSFRGLFAMQPLDLCAVRPGPAGGGCASHTEGRVTGPISLWIWKGVAVYLVWTPDVDSQRKIDERTPTRSEMNTSSDVCHHACPTLHSGSVTAITNPDKLKANAGFYLRVIFY